MSLICHVTWLLATTLLCHHLGMDVTALQERMAENVRVLLAVTGVRSQAELARRAGWEAAKVTRLLKGTQEWTLTDIVTIGEIFGLRDPFLIGKPLADVVGAVQPAAASGITAGGKQTLPVFSGGTAATIIPFPRRRSALAATLTHSARVITLGRHRPKGTVATHTASVAEIANRVTAAGGL